MNFYQAQAYLNHWLDAVDEHSIHSPFFFDFYTRIIHGDSERQVEFEKTREKLLNDNTIVTVEDLGAPSQHFRSSQRTIGRIAATSLSREKYCQLFYRMAEFIEAKKIVELGTSMGITSLYLSNVPTAKVVTFEGNHAMIDIARKNFEKSGKRNVDLIEGNIDQTLSDHLQNPAKIHFALIDANHRYEPTMRYFNMLSRRMADHSIIVIDDIYRSAAMGKAWRELRKHELVYGSVDLFHCGILFFDLALNKQHFIWQF